MPLEWADSGLLHSIMTNRGSIGRENDLVGANLTGLTADELIRIIGIDVVRVEQGRVMNQGRALGIERVQALNPFGAFGTIAGEAEQAVLTENCGAGEIDDDEQRHRRPSGRTDQRKRVTGPTLHRSTESRLANQFKQKAGELCES